MIGIILIYFVGKAFYDLAHEHDRSRWGFAILGVLSYYAGTFLAGVVAVFIYDFILLSSIDDVPEIGLQLAAVPIGILTCWGFYKILQSHWREKSSVADDSEVLDANLMD